MKKIVFGMIILMGLSSLAFAHNCPPIGKVALLSADPQKKEYFSDDEDLTWFGRAEGGAGKIKNFLSVFYDAKNELIPFQEGKLLYCRYRTEHGGTVDIRLLNSNGEILDNSAQIAESAQTYWQPRFGKTLYTCVKGTEACRFNLTSSE